MSAPAAECTRYPCDTAYRHGTHELDADGTVVHQVGLSGDGGLDGGWWDVAVVAFGEGPWQVAVRVGAKGEGELTVIPPDSRQGIGRARPSAELPAAALENAGRFARELMQAIVWAASAEIQGR